MKNKPTKITKSNPSDAPALTAIAKSAKKYWGYSDEQMKKWEHEKFYLKMGGRRIGEKESSIKGRMLPILEFNVE